MCQTPEATKILSAPFTRSNDPATSSEPHSQQPIPFFYARLLQVSKQSHSVIISIRRPLTQSFLQSRSLITFIHQIFLKGIINPQPIRFREPPLGLIIPIPKIMSLAAIKKVKPPRLIRGVTTSVIGPVQSCGTLCRLRGEERCNNNAE